MSETEAPRPTGQELSTEPGLAPIAAKLGRIAAVRSHVSTLRSSFGDGLDRMTGTQFPVTADSLRAARNVPRETIDPGAMELKRDLAPVEPEHAGNPLFSAQPRDMTPRPVQHEE